MVMGALELGGLVVSQTEEMMGAKWRWWWWEWGPEADDTVVAAAVPVAAVVAAAASRVVEDEAKDAGLVLLLLPHLTVTRPLGSDKNHSERCLMRSVCFWWTCTENKSGCQDISTSEDPTLIAKC